MSVKLTERRVAGIRWITAEGAREDVFEALGRHAKADIAHLLEDMPERKDLRAQITSPHGAPRYAALRERTSRLHRDACAELEALARGAGQDVDEVYAANFRGDIGGGEEVGCTDVQWSGPRPVIGHNEDGAPAAAEAFSVVTLRIDGEAPVFALWYPGFLPSNALTLTEHLWVSINHLPVPVPGEGAGRHFVARDLRHCRSIEEAVDYLTANPSAGGFSYNLAELRTGRIAQIESAAGATEVRWLSEEGELDWHTNHVRYLSGSDEPVSAAGAWLGHTDESEQRAAWLERLAPRALSASEVMQVLTGAELPDGVFRTGRDDDPLMTLCSTVLDIASGAVALRRHSGDQEIRGVAELLQG